MRSERPDDPTTDSDDRKRHWDDVYSRKADVETSWFEPPPETSLSLLDEVGIGVSARVIDIGGGTSRLVDHLLERGSSVTVLDVSRAALDACQRRLGSP